MIAGLLSGYVRILRVFLGTAHYSMSWLRLCTAVRTAKAAREGGGLSGRYVPSRQYKREKISTEKRKKGKRKDRRVLSPENRTPQV